MRKNLKAPRLSPCSVKMHGRLHVYFAARAVAGEGTRFAFAVWAGALFFFLLGWAGDGSGFSLLFGRGRADRERGAFVLLLFRRVPVVVLLFGRGCLFFFAGLAGARFILSCLGMGGSLSFLAVWAADAFFFVAV